MARAIKKYLVSKNKRKGGKGRKGEGRRVREGGREEVRAVCACVERTVGRERERDRDTNRHRKNAHQPTCLPASGIYRTI